MKKYEVVILSFALLYVVGQVISGWILTVFDTHNLSLVNDHVG